jgi:hypothetical protein
MGLDAALRSQLVDARDKIIAQLDELNYLATAKGFARHGGGPPDYRPIAAELEQQLREICAILDTDDQARA